jgi:hypothetical protein
MDSSTSADVATTGGQSNSVQKRRNWPCIIISSVFGGAIAVIAAPTIATLMPVGTVGFILGTTTTGMLGSVTTRVTGNAIDSSRVVLTIYQIQQFYRKTMVQYIGTTLESVITSIRKNSHFTSHNREFFEVGDNFHFEGVEAKENCRMFFDFSFKVVPLLGTLPRPLDQSVPASDLPNYELDSTCYFEFGTNKHLLDGISGAVVEGAVFGLFGGAVAKAFPVLMKPGYVQTVPREIGIIVGVSSATGIAEPIKSLTFPSTTPNHAALFIEFATEAQHQVNRLVHCALENGVGLELDMNIGSTTENMGTVKPCDVAAAQHCQFYWSVSEKVNLT